MIPKTILKYFIIYLFFIIYSFFINSSHNFNGDILRLVFAFDGLSISNTGESSDDLDAGFGAGSSDGLSVEILSRLFIGFFIPFKVI